MPKRWLCAGAASLFSFLFLVFPTIINVSSLSGLYILTQTTSSVLFTFVLSPASGCAQPSYLRSEVYVSVCFFSIPRMAIVFDRKNVSWCHCWNTMFVFDHQCCRPDSIILEALMPKDECLQGRHHSILFADSRLCSSFC